MAKKITNGIIGWAFTIFLINIVVFSTMAFTDGSFRTSLLADAGSDAYGDWTEFILAGDGKGAVGMNKLTSEQESVTPSRGIDISVTGDDVDIDEVEDQNTGLLQFFEQLIDAVQFLGRIANITGLIVVATIGTSIALYGMGSQYNIWIYMVTIPLNLWSLRNILRFMFPTRIE